MICPANRRVLSVTSGLAVAAFAGSLFAVSQAVPARDGTPPAGTRPGTQGRPAATASLPAIDPQKWQDQQDMTWDDYHPIPGVNWADPALTPGRALRVALVAIDFDDQPFVVTLPKGSDPFGNPQVDPIERDDVARFYASFSARPDR